MELLGHDRAGGGLTGTGESGGRHGRSLHRGRDLAASHADPRRATGDRAAGLPAVGAGADRLPAGAAALDGAQDPEPLRLPAAGLDRPGTGVRIRAQRRQVHRYVHDATRATWSTSTSRSSDGSPTAAAGTIHGRSRRQDSNRRGSRDRLRLHPQRRRRPHPPGLQRDARRRTQGDRRRVLVPRQRVLRRPPASPSSAVLTDNGSCYRSKLFAQTLGDSDHAQADPALPTPDQRQGRAVQPDPARGMGLRPALPLRSRTRRRLPRLAPHLQSPPRPHRTRRQVTSRPRAQPVWTEHLDPGRGQAQCTGGRCAAVRVASGRRRARRRRAGPRSAAAVPSQEERAATTTPRPVQRLAFTPPVLSGSCSPKAGEREDHAVEAHQRTDDVADVEEPRLVGLAGGVVRGCLSDMVTPFSEDEVEDDDHREGDAGERERALVPRHAASFGSVRSSRGVSE